MHRDAVVACDGAGPLSVGPCTGMASPDFLLIAHLHTTTATAAVVALLSASVQGLARRPLIVGSQCTTAGPRPPPAGFLPPSWARRGVPCPTQAVTDVVLASLVSSLKALKTSPLGTVSTSKRLK
jgi:hypothetical protein